MSFWRQKYPNLNTRGLNSVYNLKYGDYQILIMLTADSLAGRYQI